MIKALVKKNLQSLRFHLSASNNPLFIGFYKYFYSPKKMSLSEFLSVYSLSKKDSFYVIQIGANDGITHDPIHKYIKRDNWKGVLLEPQSFVHDNYLEKIYAKNKGIHTLCAAISPEDGFQTLYKLGFCTMRWATGLASFQRDNVEKAITSGLVASKSEKYKIAVPNDEELIVEEKVRTISPTTLLQEYSISNIDLLQIDVEGYDYEVIKIFEIQKLKPKVIIFEHSHLSKDDKASCFEHLQSNNYAYKKYGANTLAMLNPLEDFEKYFR